MKEGGREGLSSCPTGNLSCDERRRRRKGRKEGYAIYDMAIILFFFLFFLSLHEVRKTIDHEKKMKKKILDLLTASKSVDGTKVVLFFSRIARKKKISQRWQKKKIKQF